MKIFVDLASNRFADSHRNLPWDRLLAFFAAPSSSGLPKKSVILGLVLEAPSDEPRLAGRWFNKRIL